jgi:hypothetical protein
MAEAMALGVSVIGTDFSGSTDFLSEKTGFPVSYTLRSVMPNEYVWTDGQSWADPDLGVAAEMMRQVASDRMERHKRAEAGKALIAQRYGARSVGAMIADRIRCLSESGGGSSGVRNELDAQHLTRLDGRAGVVPQLK